MRLPGPRRGVTLAEMMVAMAILGIISIAFAGFLKYALRTAVVENTQAQGQEAVRQGLELAEAALVHANEITIASSTLVEFIADSDQSPFWDRNATDCGGVPAWRSTDVDCDAATLAVPADAWKSGFNLTDDDDDGDGNVDVRERIYLQNGALYRDMSLNGAAWGGRVVKLLPNVSTFTLTYWGSKGNQLGASIDTNADGAISQSEMDCAAGGGGNCDGSLDLQIELSYITSVRLSIGVDGNKDGKTEYKVDTDVYPPLLPLKPLQ